MVGAGEGEERPPKRQRTSSGSIDTCAQGQVHRQNRWMQGYDNSANAYASDIAELLQTPPAASRPNSNRPANAIPNAATRSSNSPLANVITIDLEEGTRNVPAAATTRNRVTSGAVSLTQQEPPSSRTSFVRMLSQSAPDIVRYESPGDTMTATTMPTVLANGVGRKSVDNSARSSAQPGLPSPAPSDENNNSPTFSENQLAALRNRAVEMASGLAPVSPNVMQGPASFPTQQQHVRQNSMPSQQPRQIGRAPNVQAHAHTIAQGQRQQQSMQQPQRTASHGHQQRQSISNNIQIPPYAGQNLQANGQPLRTPPTVPSHHGQPQQSPKSIQPAPLAASRIPTNVLLSRMDAKEAELRSELKPTDIGRLALLREAVKRGDWFYQLLSQIFCLRSESPSLLPRSVKGLGQSSWEFLGFLLCPNTEVNNKLLQFFAEFPEPIMDIYSDPGGAREIYEGRAKSVSDFLTKLPRHWDGLVARCRQMFAPPLVQDMVEVLDLKSVVLQTTCFRAIARMFWGVEESLGIKTLEAVHHMDQSYFYGHGYSRNPQEKGQAYLKLGRVYQAWTDLVQASHGAPIHAFAIPDDVRTFFESPTQAALMRMQQTMIQQRPTPAQPQPQSPSYPPQQAPVQHRQDTNQMMLQQRYQQVQQSGRGGPSQMRIHSPHVVQSQLRQAPSPQTPLLQQHQAVLSTLPQANGFTVSPQTMSNPLWGMQGAPKAKKRSLFPTEKEVPRAQPTHPNPTTSALHQALLRSPIPGPAVLKEDSPKLYRHTSGYALVPTKIKRRTPVQQASFNLSVEAYDKIAKPPIPSQLPGERPTRILEEGMITYRLRCAVLPPTGFTSEHAWAVAENVWPEEFAFAINDVPLSTRRKLHHGRYLPIDLTTHLRRGENTLRIVAESFRADKRKTRYSFAVEAVTVISHSTLTTGLKRVSAEESLVSIKKTLAGDDPGDDDDIAVTSSSMTIKLFDPYSSARLVDTPVRGVNCLHKDVFDLEIFLSMCKREKPSWPTVVDCWRCPLCRGDVRPQTLLVDEFLVRVIADLKNQNMLDVKAIVVEADGTWKPKEEERTGVRSPSLERELRGSLNRSIPPASTALAPAPPRAVEIIELD